MNKGMTLVETVIAIAGVSTIAIIATNFFYQTMVSRDKALALVEATEVANSVLTRIKYAVPQATDLDIVNGSELRITSDTGCEEFVLTSGRIYHESATSPCPITATQNLITNASANITNTTSPAITLFTGNATGTDALTVTTQIRVRVTRPFANGEVTLRDSVSRRR